METVFETTDYEIFRVSTDQKRWISKVLKYKEAHPDEVEVIAYPENNDGCLYAKIPSSWVKLSPPRHISEEQRLAAAERLKAHRPARKGGKADEGKGS